MARGISAWPPSGAFPGLDAAGPAGRDLARMMPCRLLNPRPPHRSAPQIHAPSRVLPAGKPLPRRGTSVVYIHEI